VSRFHLAFFAFHRSRLTNASPFPFFPSASFERSLATIQRPSSQPSTCRLYSLSTLTLPPLLTSIYFLASSSFSNHIFPSYTPSADLGVGSQIISGALKSVTGLSQAALRKLGDKLGDGGDVAFEAKVSSRRVPQSFSRNRRC